MNILTISDDPATIADVINALQEAGHDIIKCTAQAPSVLDNIVRSHLVVLCWQHADAPDAVIEQWQAYAPGVPIIVVLTQQAVAEIIAVLDAGADDCMRVPLLIGEFMARVRALLRRCSGDLDTLKRGPIVVNQRARQAWLEGQPMALNDREFAILTMLVRRADQLVTRKEILAEVWQRSRPPTSNLIEVYIRHLRNKMGPLASNLQTVRGKGYVFVT